MFTITDSFPFIAFIQSSTTEVTDNQNFEDSKKIFELSEQLEELRTETSSTSLYLKTLLLANEISVESIRLISELQSKNAALLISLATVDPYKEDQERLIGLVESGMEYLQKLDRVVNWMKPAN